MMLTSSPLHSIRRIEVKDPALARSLCETMKCEAIEGVPMGCHPMCGCSSCLSGLGQTEVKLVGGALDSREEMALYLGVAALLFTAYQTWLMHQGHALKLNPRKFKKNQNPYIPKKEIVKEHKRLLKLLKKEADLQARELIEYQKAGNPEPCEYVAHVNFQDANRKDRSLETKPFKARTMREASDRLWKAVKAVMPVGAYRIEKLGIQLYQC